MNQKFRKEFNFSFFKGYAAFLLKNHLNELSHVYLNLLQSLEVPLLKLFSHLEHAELLQLIQSSLQQFLEDAIHDRALTNAMGSVDQWKEGKYPGIKKEDVGVADIVLTYSVRKQSYLQLLPLHTQDIAVFSEIAAELELFHIHLQQYAFNTYVDIQQEQLNDKNKALKAYQKELQASNEELMQSEEELAATNEELVEKLQKIEGMHLKLKENEQGLEKSLTHYLTLFKDFPALIWRSDLSGGCDYFNDTWLTFTGKTMQEEYGDGWAKGVHPDDLDRCLKIYSDSFQARLPFEMEYRLRRADGAYRWIIDFGKPLFDINNLFSGFLGVCYDITEQKENEKQLIDINKILQKSNDQLKVAEELLRKLNDNLEENVQERTRELELTKQTLLSQNEKLQKLNEYMDNFVFAAAHDLRSPVVNLKLLVDSINRPELSHHRENFLGALDTMVSRLDKTLNGLVQIIEVQSEASVTAEKIRFIDAIQLAQDEFFNEIEACQATFDLSIDADCREIVYFEPFLLSIIKNLMSNSIKFCSGDRLLIIKINVFKSGNFTVMSFSDNGMGIDLEKHRKNLFKAFNRFSKQSDGTGIGLHLIKSMVEKNGGKVELESTVSEGTKVKVYFKEYTNHVSNIFNI